eukprot:5209491-Amphidinium_carterae.2
MTMMTGEEMSCLYSVGGNSVTAEVFWTRSVMSKLRSDNSLPLMAIHIWGKETKTAVEITQQMTVQRSGECLVHSPVQVNSNRCTTNLYMWLTSSAGWVEQLSYHRAERILAPAPSPGVVSPLPPSYNKPPQLRSQAIKTQPS